MAPLQGPITLDVVFRAPPSDIDAIAHSMELTLQRVPELSEGWEKLKYSRDPFQTALGIRSVAEFERGLQLLMLSKSEQQYALDRFVPYPGERRGFALDERWQRKFDLPIDLREIAKSVVDALADGVIDQHGNWGVGNKKWYWRSGNQRKRSR